MFLFYITALHDLCVHLPRKLNLQNKAASPWVRLRTLWPWICLLWVTDTSDWYQIHTWLGFSSHQEVVFSKDWRVLSKENYCKCLAKFPLMSLKCAITGKLVHLRLQQVVFVESSAAEKPLRSPRKSAKLISHWKTLQSVSIPLGCDSDVWAKSIGDDGQTPLISQFVQFLEKRSSAAPPAGHLLSPPSWPGLVAAVGGVIDLCWGLSCRRQEVVCDDWLDVRGDVDWGSIVREREASQHIQR